MTFLVVVLSAQSKTDELTISPTLQTSHAAKKILKKLTACSAWGALTTSPYKLRLGGARAPSAPSGYAC